jgi:hypothetical protein
MAQRRYKPSAKRRRIPIDIGVTVSDRGAVWIKFPTKPPDEILAELRACEFRFHRSHLAWAQKATEENVELASGLWGLYLTEDGGSNAE